MSYRTVETDVVALWLRILATKSTVWTQLSEFKEGYEN